MPDDPMTFTENESKVLIAVYQHGANSTSELVTNLFGFQPYASPESQKAFKDTMTAIEGLIVKGLIDGETVGTGESLSFKELKLKFRGKHEAIKERNRVSALKQEEEDAPKIAAELKRALDREATTKPQRVGNPQTHDVID